MKYVYIELSDGSRLSTFPEVAELLESIPRTKEMDGHILYIASAFSLIAAQAMAEGYKLAKAEQTHETPNQSPTP